MALPLNMENITTQSIISTLNINFNKKFISGHNRQTNSRKSNWRTADSSDRSVMQRLHYTNFIGAYSSFNTVHKWAQAGLIEWVCGFLLTLQGPLHPTPARKQIKLQFHHLEGAVSCPNAALSPPLSTYTRHTKLYTSASSELLGSPAPKMPASFHCSIAKRNGGIWGKKEGKRGMGGSRGKGDWEYARGSYCSFIPVKYFCCGVSKGRKREKQKGYTAVASR